MPLRFYTFPPDSIAYPFVLVNARRIDQQMRYLIRYKRQIKAIIVDSGIEIFRDRSIKEYPLGPEAWIRRQARTYYFLKMIMPSKEIYITIPDYCDDYFPKNLWISKEITNIERTLRNIEYAIDNYSDVNWLIPVQGHFKKPNSILRSLKWMEETGILKKFNFFAIANLCTEKERYVMITTLRIARRYLADKKIHVFGLKKNIIEQAYKRGLLDSSDSTAWTRPCGLTQKIMRRYYNIKKNYSCKTSRERIIYFITWILSLAKNIRYDIDLPQDLLNSYRLMLNDLATPRLMKSSPITLDQFWRAKKHE